MTRTTPDHGTEACARVDSALARAFNVLGKRWSSLILYVLRDGPVGFREISRAVHGVSDSVLSDRLCELAAVGLVTRTVDEGPPVSVTYALLPSGEALLPALEQVANWAEEHLRPTPDR